MSINAEYPTTMIAPTHASGFDIQEFAAGITTSEERQEYMTLSLQNMRDRAAGVPANESEAGVYIMSTPRAAKALGVSQVWLDDLAIEGKISGMREGVGHIFNIHLLQRELSRLISDSNK